VLGLPAAASAALTPWEFVVNHRTHHPQLLFLSNIDQPTMSAATWRQFFTYDASLKYLLLALIDFIKSRYNKYTQIAARAVRQSLKENERVVAEKRGLTALRYQHWEGGKGGEQVAFFLPPVTSYRVWLTHGAVTAQVHLYPPPEKA